MRRIENDRRGGDFGDVESIDEVACGRVGGGRIDATPRGEQALATERPTAPGVTPKPATPATPEPKATTPPPRTPTPTPTPEPTVAPPPVTPPPTPTPDPTPTCKTVPQFVGMTVANARAEWTAAGFTGQFDPRSGQNDKIVATQTQPAGACLPATTGIRVRF